MGNEEIKENTLENTILDKDPEEIKSMNEAELQNRLYNVLTIFNNNPDAFKKLKEEDLKNLQNSKTEKYDEDNEEAVEKLTKAQKFRNFILSFLVRKFNNEYESIFTITLRLARLIIKDKLFLLQFMRNKYDDFCAFLVNIEIWKFLASFREVCLFFSDIVEEYSSKYDVDPSTFTKMFLVFNKIDQEEFSVKYDIYYSVYYSFIKLVKTLIKFVFFLYIKGKKETKSRQREIVEQIKTYLNELSAKGILKYMIEKFFNLDKIYEVADFNDVKRMLGLKKTEEEKKKQIKVKKDKEKDGTMKQISSDEIQKKFNEEWHVENKYISNDQVDFKNTPHSLTLESVDMLVHMSFVFEERLIRSNNIVPNLFRFFISNNETFKKEDKKKIFRKKYLYFVAEKALMVVVNFYIFYFQAKEEDPSTDSFKFLNFENEEFDCETRNMFYIVSYLIGKEEEAIRPKDDSNSDTKTPTKTKENETKETPEETKEENEEKEERMDIIYIENLELAICLFFYCLSINRGIYKTFIDSGYISTVNECIILYIKRTFNKKGELNDERIIRIHNIMNFLEFITCDNIQKKIKHTTLYVSLIPIPSLLFYINFPFFRVDLLKIINFFVHFEGCKEALLEDKYLKLREELYNRIEYNFEGLKKSNIMAKSLLKQYLEIKEQLRQVEISPNSTTYENIVRANKLTENKKITSSLYFSTKTNFLSQFNEFGLLISIFVNLMIQNDYEKGIIKLCCNKFDKVDKFFHFEDVEEQYLFVRKEERSFYVGEFLTFYDFFKNECEFKKDLFNTENNKNNIYLKNYILQILLAIFIHSPELHILLDVNDNPGQITINPQIYNIQTLFEMIKINNDNYELLQKIFFALTRYFDKEVLVNSKEIIDITRIFLNDIKDLLQNKHIPIYTSREIFKFLNSLLKEKQNCLLWMKMENKKYQIDSINRNDVTIKSKLKNNDTRNLSLLHTDGDVPENETRDETEKRLMNSRKIIALPFKRINPYKNKFGVLTYSTHSIQLLNSLELEDGHDQSFTISFFFFNPVITSNKLHVLIQDETGSIPLVAIDRECKSIGCFDIYGNFIDSGIDLTLSCYKNKWLHFTIIYDSKTTEANIKLNGEISFYLNGQLVENISIGSQIPYFKTKIYSLESKKVITLDKKELPNKIKFIGNSKDFSYPFGAFCDLRIYKGVKTIKEVEKIFRAYEPKFQNENEDTDLHKIILELLGEVLINYCLSASNMPQEVCLYLTKFLNSIICRNDVRYKFLNYKFIVKVAKDGLLFGLSNKKEVTKLLRNVS